MALAAAPLVQDRLWTEDEFDAWCLTSDARVEFVDGRVLTMSPVLTRHDDLFHFISRLLGLFLELRPIGSVHGPELLVRLRRGLQRMPDVFVVLNQHAGRVGRSRVDGAPDVAWELVSEESAVRDWNEKFADYAANGVPEYWIVDPEQQVVRLFRLSGSAYAEVLPVDGRLHSTVLPGFWIRPEWLWQSPLPGALACLREMGVLE